MTELLNNLPHRIVRDGRTVRAGERFESDDPKDLARFPEAGERVPVEDPGPSPDADLGQAITEVNRLGRLASTAPLRDAFDGETGDTVKGTGLNRNPNAPSVGATASPAITDHPLAQPNQPAPVSGPSPVSTGVPGHDHLADERTSSADTVASELGDGVEVPGPETVEAPGEEPGEGPAPEEVAAASKDGDEGQKAPARPGESTPADDLKFSSDAARDKAIEGGVLSQLEAGKGSGKSPKGAFTVADVEAAISKKG